MSDEINFLNKTTHFIGAGFLFYLNYYIFVAYTSKRKPMDINPEDIVDQKLMEDDRGRKIQTNMGDSGWGQLIFPSEKETLSKTDQGLRVVVFGSYLLGYLLTEALHEFERRNPSRLNIVGLVTDDPASPSAKISAKRRIWRKYNQEETIHLETAMIESGLKYGVPVYTGAVKTEYFRNLLKTWNPDVILVCVFGQIIDAPIINYPKQGIFNFHPADLLAGHGAGPQPFQDLIDRQATTSKVTIHQLTTDLDGGPILGQSPPINVRFADGGMTDNVLVLDDKMLQPIDVMGALLIKTLILHKEANRKGAIKKLDFTRHFVANIKEWLMQPIKFTEPSVHLPEPSTYVNYSL